MRDNGDSIDKESNQGEDLFLLYCQEGLRRSLKGLAASSGKSLSYIKKLSIKNNWVTKAAIFDHKIRESHWCDDQSHQDPYQSLIKAMRQKIELTVEDYHVPKTVNLAQLGRALESLMRLEQLSKLDEGVDEGKDRELCHQKHLTIEVIAIDA